MKFYKYFYLLKFILIFNSCSPQNDDYFGEPVSRDTFRPIKQIIFDASANSTDTLIYNYIQDNDFYPSEIICKSSEDSILWVKKYEFDSWRLPDKEMLLINDSLIQTTLLKYSPKNYYLLEKTVFNGIDIELNKISQHFYIYEDDYLVSIINEKYSIDTNYMNIDSNKLIEYDEIKVLPNEINRFKGASYPLDFTAKYIKYWTHEDKKAFIKKKKAPEYKMNVGDIYKMIDTDFDTDGFPAYTLETSFDSSKNEIWYKTDRDGFGQVIELIGYLDFDCKIIAPECLNYKFYYDSEGFIYQFDRRLYNINNKKFDRVESSTSLDWIDHKINNPQNFILLKLGRQTKYFNYEKGAYFVKEHLITKFEIDEINEEFYEYQFNISKRERSRLKPSKRVVTLLEMIKVRKFRGL